MKQLQLTIFKFLNYYWSKKRINANSIRCFLSRNAKQFINQFNDFEKQWISNSWSFHKLKNKYVYEFLSKTMNIDLRIAIYDVFNNFILIAKQIINNLLSLKNNRLQICVLKKLLFILKIAMTIFFDRNMRCFEHWWYLIYWVRNNLAIIFDIAKQLCFRILCLLK